MKRQFNDARSYRTITQEQIGLLLDASDMESVPFLKEGNGVPTHAVRKKKNSEKTAKLSPKRDSIKYRMTVKVAEELMSELNRELMYDFHLLDLLDTVYGATGKSESDKEQKNEHGRWKNRLKPGVTVYADLCRYWTDTHFENYLLLMLHGSARGYMLEIMSKFLRYNFNREKGIIQLHRNYFRDCFYPCDLKEPFKDPAQTELHFT